MILKSLEANKSSFHTINFQKGVNIIVGKQVSEKNKNDGNTYNGVGKSFIMHLIHFCLGSNKISSLEEKLPDWEFTLKFEIEGKEYSATRSTGNQTKIIFCDKLMKVSEMQEKIFDLCFGKDNKRKHITWNSLFSRFVRRYRASYLKFDSHIPKEEEYSRLLNILFLLGIDVELIVEKRDLRISQNEHADLKKLLNRNSLLGEYYLREDENWEETSKIDKLENEIANFNVSSNYHEIQKEADNLSYEKKILENKRFLITNNIKNIEKSLLESDDNQEAEVVKMYESASVEIPSMMKKSIEEVLEFHKKQVFFRKERLARELNKQKIELKNLEKELKSKGAEMDEMLRYLDTHGALEEYIKLKEKVLSLQNKRNKIVEYENLKKLYEEGKDNIKLLFKEQNEKARSYLENTENVIEKLESDFQNFTKRFYPRKKSWFNISNNIRENKIRYNLDVKIEDDSSDGVNEVRLFCFDLLVLLKKQSKIRFLAHDSRVFSNMDPRQREALFRVVYETIDKTEFQYICTINEDSLESFKESMNDDEYRTMITDNIILELKDDSKESKLLGIQVDLELEEKSKKKINQ